MDKPRIRLRDDGPLVVEGDIEIVDADGNPFSVSSNRPNKALCRCGHSSNRPFCDGSHRHHNFQAADRATSE
jgi:CDGSH-type Zn-finger protein